jgi:hypothetical protein
LIEGRTLPVGWTQKDGNNTRLTSFVSLHSLLHLGAITEFGVHEIGADQEKNDLIRVHVVHDLRSPLGSGNNIIVMPLADKTLIA